MIFDRMRLMQFLVSKDAKPAWSVGLYRCAHGRLIGVKVRRGMACWLWIWRTCA